MQLRDVDVGGIVDRLEISPCEAPIVGHKRARCAGYYGGDDDDAATSSFRARDERAFRFSVYCRVNGEGLIVDECAIDVLCFVE